MRSKKVTPYDAEEQRLQAQSASIMDFLKRKGENFLAFLLYSKKLIMNFKWNSTLKS